jgi:hypothetical protein
MIPAVGYGIRGRSPNVKLAIVSSFLVDRSRQIGTMPGVSTGGAFTPHDKMTVFMRGVFDAYEKVLNCKIYSPKTEGGEIYNLIRDAYLNGQKILIGDVAGMEIITPTILNGNLGGLCFGLGCVTAYLGPIPELLSGVFPTSDFDMIAHLELLARIIPKDMVVEFIVILGDNSVLVLKKGTEGELPSTPLYGIEHPDQEILRVLGLTCTEKMHPVAHNISVDNAKKRLNIIQGQPIVNKLTSEQREGIADLFTGKVNGVELYEIIDKFEMTEGMYSPKQFVGSIVNIESI